MLDKLYWYLRALELDSDKRDDVIREQIEWVNQRLSRLESALPLYRLEDTTKTLGLARRLSELRNTISSFVYQRDRASHVEPDHWSIPERLKQFVLEAPNSLPVADAKIYVDMSCALAQPHVTGIQRVVREIARRATRYGGIPVCLSNQGAIGYDAGKDYFCNIEFKAGDSFVMLDLPLSYMSCINATMDAVRAAGGQNVALIYDLIPIMLPQTVPRGTPERFEAWFDSCVTKCEGVICISRSVASEVTGYFAEKKPQESSWPWIEWSHLGCNFESRTGSFSVVQELVSEKSPFFLSVSTLEPRKGYRVAIDAMEELWGRGGDARFVIVGRDGWGQDNLKRRIVSHREFGRRLFWFNDIGDADLAQLYRHARALIFASISEGFGLPLLEAAHFGLPSIVSDIPVFREVAGDEATYFPVADSDGLCQRLEEALASPKRAPAMPMLSWDEAAAEFFEKVRRRAPVPQFANQSSNHLPEHKLEGRAPSF